MGDLHALADEQVIDGGGQVIAPGFIDTHSHADNQLMDKRDTGNIYLTPEAVVASDEDPSNQLLGNSITYRIAVGPQQGRKVLTLQTLPDCESDNPLVSTLGVVAGFSLHAGVATKANERTKLERLCRYITRPAVSTKRLPSAGQQ